jgi:hypothetical protein
MSDSFTALCASFPGLQTKIKIEKHQTLEFFINKIRDYLANQGLSLDAWEFS